MLYAMTVLLYEFLDDAAKDSLGFRTECSAGEM